MMKDYYSTLGLERDAGEAAIKRSYRALAMRCHPDRNPGDPGAGERFREITEAYGVLMDPAKRREYDTCLRTAPRYAGPEGPRFSYSQEDIFRDLFNDPRLSAFFNEIAGDFGKSGIRFGPSFLEEIFFRRGGIFFAGAIFRAFSPMGKVSRLYSFFRAAQTAHGAFRRYRAVREDKPRGKRFLRGGIRGLFRKRESSAGDLSFRLRISPGEAEAGAEKTMAFQVNGREERLTVKVPPGTGSGTRLRIRGKGAEKSGEAGRGDIYLLIEVP